MHSNIIRQEMPKVQKKTHKYPQKFEKNTKSQNRKLVDQKTNYIPHPPEHEKT